MSNSAPDQCTDSSIGRANVLLERTSAPTLVRGRATDLAAGGAGVVVATHGVAGGEAAVGGAGGGGGEEADPQHAQNLHGGPSASLDRAQGI